MRALVAATRKSRLAMAQTAHVISMLKRAHPDAAFEAAGVSTSGDSSDRPLFLMEQRGAFSRGVDAQVLSGAADFAVHSMKDLPTALEGGLVLACVPAREAANDVIISAGGAGLKDLRRGAVVGTSSLRRAVQAVRARPDIVARPVRGNVETRIAKVGGGYDAVILAQAGISRLGLGVAFEPLPEDPFVPSPGQGALAVTAIEGTEACRMLGAIDDAGARAEAAAERALSEAVGSGCRFPVGARARANGQNISIIAAAYSMDGSKEVASRMSGATGDAAALGRRAGEDLAARGAKGLAAGWRGGLEELNRRAADG